MTPNRIPNDIRNVLSWLIEKSLAQFIQPYREVRSRGRLRICAEGSIAAQAVLKAHPFGSIAEYRGFVEAEAYSALLNDGSLLHLSYDFQNSELIGHRLLYYPCPFIIDPKLADEPILDVLEFCGNDLELFRLRSPVRFDFDLQRAAINHPASHLHFQHEECRLPIVAPLSVGRFVQFVFHNFYPHWWAEHEFLRDFRRPSVVGSIQAEERHGFHLACSLD
ncbi:MAG: DUF2290 domain-containing protein [Planctomycetota bacterium]|nr:DUF2290 domain-containing protein [Planctomycetota bacterium]